MTEFDDLIRPRPEDYQEAPEERASLPVRIVVWSLAAIVGWLLVALIVILVWALVVLAQGLYVLLYIFFWGASVS